MPKSGIFRLEAAVQHYDWGGSQYIPELLKLAPERDLAYAELWMGAHQRGPSKLQMAGAKVSLDEYIKANPRDHLSQEVTRKFGESLPYLFKVLDVKKMLSIQVHPTKAAAVAGFEAENKKGIPLNAANRNYKDDNHKPEVMVALSDFYLLHGFKTTAEIAGVLDGVAEFAPLRPFFRQRDIRTLYRAIMEMSQGETDQLLKPLADRLLPLYDQGRLSRDSPDYWAALAFRDYPDYCDRGIFSIYLFNLIRLNPGEGIFQDAGIPHAYLEGINVELMANSDNVFRGGLTTKHIDVQELLQHLVFDPVTPRILTGDRLSTTEKVYSTPAPDFELSEIRVSAGGRHEDHTRSPEIVILMEGAAELRSDQVVHAAQRGDVFLLNPDTEYLIEGEAILFKARVPLEK